SGAGPPAQVARVEPETTLRERALVTVPAVTLKGTNWDGTAWEHKIAVFRIDLKPVSNGEFLAFVKAHAQWKKSHIASNLHDEDYLKHWEGDESVKPSILDDPVQYVSFYAAAAFCNTSGKRLPRLGDYRAAANAPLWVEKIEIRYEAPYKVP